MANLRGWSVCLTSMSGTSGGLELGGDAAGLQTKGDRPWSFSNPFRVLSGPKRALPDPPHGDDARYRQISGVETATCRSEGTVSLHNRSSEQVSREESQNATEEALSANEELQSLNEELETAKEELQSTNEELITRQPGSAGQEHSAR